ncbi:TetR/AcrR family transcriptional regulator [Streptomyces similanensis]|uniref:TetR family transcriptional regulator n=1 Tax=Streptomyces similanensis TaxID=1274988 RepID=A0ABP9JX20_9ACTN
MSEKGTGAPEGHEGREGREAAGPGGRRARRHDPRRRERILDAALEVLAADGIVGLTHRKVASRADVPLGSVTYHFASLAELRTRAFAWYVGQRSAEYAALFTDVATREDLVDVLVDMVQEGPARHRSAVLGFELRLAALRDPALRALTHEWTTASRAVLARFTGPETAARLDALLEGMIMHALLSTDREPRERTRAAIAQTLGPTTATPATRPRTDARPHTRHT